MYFTFQVRADIRALVGNFKVQLQQYLKSAGRK